MGFSRQSLIQTAVRLVIAFAISFLLIQFDFDYLEAFLFDVRVRYRPSPTLSGSVELIMVDNKTVNQMKGVPGFAEYTQLLNAIAPTRPKAVVFIRGFAMLKGLENQYSVEDRKGLFSGTEKEMLEFAKAAKQFPQIYMQTDFMLQAAEAQPLSLPEPFTQILPGSGPKTSDKNILAKDGVTRRALVSYQGQTLIHPKLASEFNSEIQQKENIRGIVDIFDSEQIYIDFASPGSFPTTKFENVLEQKTDLSRFEGKLVLIGDDIGISAKDYVSTPHAREAGITMTELHANMFETFIRNSAPKQAPKWLNIFFTFVISIITLSIVLSMRPSTGLLALLATSLGFFLFAWLAFWLFGFWIGLAHPLLTIFISYYFLIPYRLIIENRRSWEYYQKHKLLSQVEELKTNFISMMSHDLKTPIARIQGMTDVILKDHVVLSSHQREAVDTIRASATDLLSFINSILNYARIENQGVELHKQAKDVNQLLQVVIKRHEFLAKVKHIEIQTELEPLFSISLDPDLMKQVFSNLLENAIKYSQENSKVLVKTAEVDGFVQIQFQDHGPGISSDELDNVFMKFFRSKNAKSSPIKGSGLGLYLAKYFVELHQGRISVQSFVGKGSTFTVELPLGS